MIMRIAFLFCIILLAGCAGGIETGTLWYCQISFTEFYEVIGSFPLDSSEVAGNSCYRVERDSQGRAESVLQYRDGVPVGYEMKFDHSGDTTSIQWFSPDGRTRTEGPSGVWSGLVDRSVDGSITVTGLDRSGELFPFSHYTEMCIYSLSDNGRSAVLTFKDRDQNPSSNWTFPWSIDLEFNNDGQIVREAYFGFNGEPVNNYMDIAVKTNEYDHNNQLVVSRNFNEDSEPADDLNHVSTTRYTYDGKGFMLTESYFDSSGEPVVNLAGIAEKRYVTDQFGFVMEESYFGPDGEPVSDQYNVSIYRWSPDSLGRMISVSCFGIDGQPIEHLRGWSTTSQTYDSDGNVVEYLHLDTDGIPSPNYMGVTRELASYDEQGLIIRLDYVDLDGNPCANTDGIASIEYSRDENGFRSERRFMDAEGQLHLNSDGVAICRWEHDVFGRELEQSYFGADGELTAFKDFDYAMITTEYSENGDRIVKYFGPDGNPVEFYGIATEHWVHTSDGSISVIRYDINGEEI